MPHSLWDPAVRRRMRRRLIGYVAVLIAIGFATPAVYADHDPHSSVMAALLMGDANLEFVSDIAFPSNESASWIAMNNGTWYLFMRQENYATRPPYCGGDFARTIVRVSYDHGQSWGPAQVAVTNDPNTAWECAALDGSTFRDPDNGTWHILEQCVNRDGPWMLCHFTSSSAVGPYTPDPSNPVAGHGSLWGQICAGPGKACSTAVVDEGTPEIMYKSGGYFYVTFHGFDYGLHKLYRGVARTSDFRNWEPFAPGLPGDSMFGPQDCNSLQGGACAGGGEGTMVTTSQFNYLLIETPHDTPFFPWSPDMRLPESNWGLSLTRGRGFPRSGEWPQYRFLLPYVGYGDPSYAHFFTEGNDVYLVWHSVDVGVTRFRKVAWNGSTLRPDQRLYPGERIWSEDHTRYLLYQGDGNLVVYDSSWRPYWNSGTCGTSPGYAVMQTDGNLVVYDGGGTPVFYTRTDLHPGSWLSLNASGMSVRDPNQSGPHLEDSIIWSANWAGETVTEWNTEYYANVDLAGGAVWTGTEQGEFVDRDWGLGGPAGLTDYFSARWARQVTLDAGTYRFYVETDDGSRVWVDGQLVVDAWYDQSPTQHSGDIYLEGGSHSVVYEYYERTVTAVAKCWWSRL